MDADLGVLCNIFKLHLRNDHRPDDQPERDKGKRILEILLRALMRGADVRIPLDYEDHASAGGRRERTSPESRADRVGRKPSLLYGSYLGKSDGYYRKYMGRRSLYTAPADRSASEYSGRAL